MICTARGRHRLYPYLFAILAAVLCQHFGLQINAEDRRDFLAASISFGAVLAGFIATSKAILMALPSDGVISRIKDSGYINDLAEYLVTAMYGALVFACLNISGFFISGDLPKWFLTLWILLGSFCLLSFTRLANLMVVILRFTGK